MRDRLNPITRFLFGARSFVLVTAALAVAATPGMAAAPRVESPLSAIVLPATGPDRSPQLAVSWNGAPGARLVVYRERPATAEIARLATHVLQTGANLFHLPPGLGADGTLRLQVKDATGMAIEGSAVRLQESFLGSDGPGLNERVFAAAVWDDGTGPALYVGGVFTIAGEVEAQHVARWDGDEWSALGAGVDGNVLALTVFDNALIVGGLFNEAGGVAANHIARWDGSAWSPLGDGVSGFPCCSGAGGVGVRSLTVFDGALIVGGTFAEAGGMTANLVARWDGSAWSPIGAGLFAHFDGPTTPTVAAFTEFDGGLIAGGQFDTLDQTGVEPAPYIARWDGSTWSALGEGMSNGVHALIERDGDLIAGGRFTEAGGVGANRIARWDGTAWSAFGPPGTEILGAVILDFREFDGALIAGGTIVEAGGVTVNHIARWDGSAWSTLSGPAGTGVGGPIDPVATLTLFDGDLIVGGRITEAGGIPVGHIARWDGAGWSPLGPFTFLAVTPEVLDFGWAIVGETTAPQSVSLQNAGTTDITITGVSDPEAPFVSAGGTCDPEPFVLPPGASCELSFTFSPTAAGPFSATVSIASDAPSNPDTATLQGIGSEDALNIQPATLDFGAVVVDEVGGPLSVTLTNADTVEIDVGTVSAPAVPFTAAGGTCGPAPFSLAPSAGCTLAYTFDPSEAGSFSETVEVMSNASSNPDSFGLVGEGVQRQWTITPELLDFGTVDIGETSEPLSVTLSNTGGAEITIEDVSAPGAPFALVDSTCASILPTGASCTLMYNFSPVAPGTVSATVKITSDASSSPDIVGLQGTGTGPAIELAPDSFNVSLVQDDATTEDLAIDNLGDTALTWSIDTAEPAPTGVLGGVVDCEGEPGIVIHDDGTAERAYSGNSILPLLIAFADRFTPGAYPAALDAVCVSFVSQGPSELDFEIVIFDDDGVDGGPGTELGALAATAEDIPMPGQPLPPDFEPVWYSYDLSSLGISVESGSVFIGARWASSFANNVLMAADESPGNPIGFAGGYTWNEISDIWGPIEGGFSEYRSMLVRTVVDTGGCANAGSAAPWLSVDPASGSTPAGGDSGVQVMVDAEGLDPGAYTASLCVESNDPIRPVAVVPVHLTVTAAPVAELTFTPGSLDFGEVDVGSTSPPQTVELQNTGDIEVSGITFVIPAGGFAADTGACGVTLAPDASCVVSVTFTPTQPGPSTSVLAVTGEPQVSAELDLTGQGVGDEGFTPVGLEVDPPGLAPDADGLFQPGEVVDVAPAWRNDGTLAQSLAGTASAFTGPPGADYTVVAPQADYGLVEPGAAANCLDTEVCYRLGLDEPAARPATHWDATFNEILDDAGGTTKTWTLHIGESFDDVPSANLFYPAIETLLHSGVTGGCSASEYCPDGANSRAQMPAFVLRALKGVDYAPPACVEDNDPFGDVPFDSTFCPWIQDLANRGIVSGCGDGDYCPGNAVTRAQMAIFLLKTLEGADYEPPGCTEQFTDVPCPSLFADWIEDLAAREITGGCTATEYCPADTVTRAQMAVFVTRTFGLTLYGP